MEGGGGFCHGMQLEIEELRNPLAKKGAFALREKKGLIVRRIFSQSRKMVEAHNGRGVGRHVRPQTRRKLGEGVAEEGEKNEKSRVCGSKK